MRSVVSGILALIVLALPVGAAEEANLPTIAVLDLSSQNVPAGELQALSDRLRTEMFKTQQFNVIERERVQSLLQEQGLQMTAGSMAAEAAAQIGQLLGAQKMVAGSIGRVGNIYTLNVRLISVGTSRIERVAVRDCSCPLEELLMNTIRQVAAEVAGLPVPDAAPVVVAPQPTPATQTISISTPSPTGGAPTISLMPVQQAAAAVNTTLRGTLGAGGSERFRFTAPQDMNISISAVKVADASLDPRVALLNSSGTEIAADDDGGDGLNALLTRPVPAGEYTIVVSAYGSTSGGFTLDVGEVHVAPAQPIALGETRNGAISSSGEQDTYTLVMNEAAAVSIFVTKGSGSSLDPKVLLRNASGTDVGTDDDGGEDNNALLSRLLRPGTYQIVVTAYGSNTGDYSVRAIQAPGNVINIGAGENRTGNLSSLGQVDLYRLELASAADITLRLDKTDGGSLDPKIFVYASDGSEIASDDDGGDGLNSMLQRNFAAGTYFVAVMAHNATTGAYSLSTGGQSVAVTPARVGKVRGGGLTLGGTVSGAISGSGEQDTYPLTIDQAGAVSIFVTKASGSSLDPKVAVRNSSGTEVGSDDDSGEDNNALLSRYLRPGSYTVVVTAYGSNTGDYAVRAIQSPGNVSSMSVGENRSGRLSSLGQVDLYRVELTSATDLALRLDKIDSGSLDPKLFVYASDGTEVAMDDDGGDGLNSLLQRNFHAGSYFVAVMSHNGTMGDYTLRVDGGGTVQRVRAVSGNRK